MLKINFNDPLPSEYECLMPDGLSPLDKYNWRKHKFGELRMNGLAVVDDDGHVTISSSDRTMKEQDAANIDANDEHNDNMTADDVYDAVPKPVTANADRPVNNRYTAKKSQQAGFSKNNAVGYECVREIPKSTMNALRQLFPGTAGKADLISAAVYILTNGTCDISERAMELVQAYNADDKLVSIDDRLAHLERICKQQMMLLHSIELCTCFNTFDRRYGSTMPRTGGAKATEFREQANLDMLERLREQAKDQARIDELERGRQIYDQIKDKNE